MFIHLTRNSLSCLFSLGKLISSLQSEKQCKQALRLHSLLHHYVLLCKKPCFTEIVSLFKSHSCSNILFKCKSYNFYFTVCFSWIFWGGDIVGVFCSFGFFFVRGWLVGLVWFPLIDFWGNFKFVCSSLDWGKVSVVSLGKKVYQLMRKQRRSHR